MSKLKGPPEGALAVPQISEVCTRRVLTHAVQTVVKLTNRQTDLSSFHAAHFGEAALTAFGKDFLHPDKAGRDEVDLRVGDEYYEDEEDDGLGYYPDGVKRTLTDEQIAMFRHSELQALQKAQEKAQEKQEQQENAQGMIQRRRNSSSPIPMDLEEDEGEEGELPDEAVQQEAASKKKKKNKKKKRGSGNAHKKQWEPDPERRKRTWDVVETGLDALDYGEMGQAGSAAERVAQRRRITYDDG